MGGSYAVIATVQDDLIQMTGDIPTTTWLTNHKPDIDSETDDTFQPFVDAIPYISSAPNDMIAYANFRLAALWFATNKDFNSQKYWDGRADKIRDKIIAAARALPFTNPRTQTVVAAADPRDSKIPLPTQAGIFAFDDYA